MKERERERMSEREREREIQRERGRILKKKWNNSKKDREKELES